MSIPAEKLAGLLAYCRIDDPDETERALLDTLYDAAVGYLDNAGVSQPEAGTPRAAQYDLAVNYLVLDAYDRRDAATSGALSDNPAFRRLIVQLKLTEPAVQE